MLRCGRVPSLLTWDFHSVVDRLCPDTEQRSLVKILKIEIITAKKKNPKHLIGFIRQFTNQAAFCQQTERCSEELFKVEGWWQAEGGRQEEEGQAQSRLAVARSLSFSGQRPQWWAGGSWLAGSRFHFWQNWDCNSVRSQCANMWLGTISQFIVVLLLSCF